MKKYTLYWSKHRTGNSIRVEALIQGRLSLREFLYIKQMRKPDVVIEVIHGETKEQLYSGPYSNELLKALKDRKINESRSTSKLRFYLIVDPPIKG